MFIRLKNSTRLDMNGDRVPNEQQYQRHQKTIKDKKKTISQAQVVLCALNKGEERKRFKLKSTLNQRRLKSGVHELISNILKTFKISRDQYHCHNFNGDGCKAICQKADAIFEVLSQELSKFTFRTDKNEDRKILTKLQKLINNTSRIIGDISICYSMMIRYDPPTEEDENLLETVISSFSHLWRQLEISVTPKSHYYESHLLFHIKLYGAMGFDNEQIVERAHARENALTRIYCNVQDENRKYRLIYLRTFLDHSAFMQAMTEKLKIIRQQRRNQRTKKLDTTSKRGRDLHCNNNFDGDGITDAVDTNEVNTTFTASTNTNKNDRTKRTKTK